MPSPRCIERSGKLDLGYIFATYFFEKQNPRSVSTDLVVFGSRTTHLAANKSQQADPLLAFCGILAGELNLLNFTFSVTIISKY